MSGREWIPTTAQVKDSTSLDGATALDEAEFDRWLAQHDAEVAGKALRDAADEAERYDRIGRTPRGQVADAEIDFYQTCGLREVVHGQSRYGAAVGVAAWLRVRATTTTEGV